MDQDKAEHHQRVMSYDHHPKLSHLHTARFVEGDLYMPCNTEESIRLNRLLYPLDYKAESECKGHSYLRVLKYHQKK